MRTFKIGAVGTTLAMLVAQPIMAQAQDFRADERSSSAFAGVNITLPLGTTKPAKPRARLQVTTSHTVRDERTGEVRTIRPAGIELGVTGSGKPEVTFAGRTVKDVDRKMKIGGTVTTVLVVSAVVLALAIVAMESTPPQIYD